MAQKKRNTEKHAVAPEGSVPTRRRFFTRLWAVLGGLAFVELIVVSAVFLRWRKPAHSEGGRQAIIYSDRIGNCCTHVLPGRIAKVIVTFYITLLTFYDDSDFLFFEVQRILVRVADG